MLASIKKGEHIKMVDDVSWIAFDRDDKVPIEDVLVERVENSHLWARDTAGTLVRWERRAVREVSGRKVVLAEDGRIVTGA